MDLTRFKARHFLNIPINGWISQTSWELVREAQKRGMEEKPACVVLCLLVPVRGTCTYMRACKHAGKITRGWAATSESRWTQALAEGVNIIATEKVRYHHPTPEGKGLVLVGTYRVCRVVWHRQIVGNSWAHLVPFKGEGRPFTPLSDWYQQ